MNWLKKIQILILVVLVFFGTTGVTIYHHICACSAQPALANQSCCESVETPSCCETVSIEPPPSPETDHKGCSHDHKGCKDIPLYFKASLLGLPVVQKEPYSIHLPEFDISLASVFRFQNIEDLQYVLVDRPDPPPLITGRSLVYSLHQPKIPSIS